ncbi:hypothetical protein [Lentibacillus sp. Marseille-P4043]|uniref:hypothetical protein n=1 Tax=Lentibacillus sp. Marseille-P4043 TaxID=2040293 RepID=UPI000D0B96F3|nr:hypothetical protein [Lentibacillus sp. Marseille-P4043]
MNLKEVYTEAISGEFESLSLLIEFLVFEKQVLTFDDDRKELDLYFKPNNKARMNKLLLEYRTKLGESA